MTPLNFKNILIIIFCFILNVTLSQELITDRPDQTESSSTVPKGSLQIESGVLLGFTENAKFSERQILAPTTLFRYGIFKGFEIRLLSQFESLKLEKDLGESSGISDLELGTKIQILQKEDVNTEIAFLSHLVIPTGSSSLSNVDYGSINKISIAHTINDKLGIGYNLGYNYFGKGNGDFTYSLALGIGINDKVAMYIEPFGELVEFEDHLANFDAGITYLLNKNFQLDFSFGAGINHTMNYLSAGFSWIVYNKENNEK